MGASASGFIHGVDAVREGDLAVASFADLTVNDTYVPSPTSAGVADISSNGDSLIQRVTHVTRYPPVCTDPHDQIWDTVCGHWKEVIKHSAVENGANICCEAIPEACLEPGKTCSESSECEQPSYANEVWYLQHFELGVYKTLDQAHIKPVDCLFKTAKKNVRLSPNHMKDNPNAVGVLVHKMLEDGDFEKTNAILREELGLSPASLLDNDSFKKYAKEKILQIQFRQATSNKFFVVDTQRGQFRIEKSAPYDVRLSREEGLDAGRLEAEVVEDALAPSLTLADVLSHVAARDSLVDSHIDELAFAKKPDSVHPVSQKD